MLSPAGRRFDRAEINGMIGNQVDSCQSFQYDGVDSVCDNHSSGLFESLMCSKTDYTIHVHVFKVQEFRVRSFTK